MDEVAGRAHRVSLAAHTYLLMGTIPLAAVHQNPEQKLKQRQMCLSELLNFS